MLSEKFYRPFGRTGLKVSPICLGTDNFANPTPKTESIEIINYAIESGINLIDTSNSYAQGESEKIIGEALKNNGYREDVLIASKFYFPTGKKGINDRGVSRKHIFQACEASLKRLGTDYIDLYQMHRVDMDTPLEETLSALTDLVRQGKIRYFGSTTSPAWKISESKMLSEFKNLAHAVSEQLPYNLLDRRVENEILPASQWANLAVLAWSPLAMGMLAGRYDNTNPDSFNTARFNRGGIYAERISKKAVDTAQKFVNLARKWSYEPAHLALLWVKDQEGITAPLHGPRTLEQLKDIIPLMAKSFPEELRDPCNEIVPPGSAAANFLNSAPWMKGKLI
ncbi:MAG: aldo/keto reductase [Saprospiraceae bacterium]|nr:aldo/keto reductase [Saprospiraceae bacterium]